MLKKEMHSITLEEGFTIAFRKVKITELLEKRLLNYTQTLSLIC